MKTPFAIFLVVTVLACNVPAFQDRGAGTNAAQEAIIPLIVMDQVPLRDAVKNLTRQMGQRNYIFDPRVIASFAGLGGESASEPMVSGRWEKVTAEQALTAMLTEHKLKLVKNPATTVARIVPANDASKPTPAIQSKDSTMPVIMMTDVALGEAITNLARQALLLPIVLDPQLSAPASGFGGKALSESAVTFRWDKLSSGQALSAVLENYGLVLVPGGNGEPATVTKLPTAK